MKLFEDLLKLDIAATGVMRVSRKVIPNSVVALKTALDRKDVSRGIGYYIRESGSAQVYVCWHDKGGGGGGGGG